VPIVNPIPGLLSPPTNCFGLYQYLAQRLPGYDPSEYLREINAAYIHVWEEVTKLKNQYFTRTKLVTVVKSQTEYDLMFNNDGALSAPVSNRLYQITRIRVLPSNGGLFQNTIAMAPNARAVLDVSANPQAQPAVTGPYYFYVIGQGSVSFGLPLQVGTQLEVIYSYWPLALTFMYQGSVSSATNVVTGLGTTFTQLLQPDFQQYQPATGTVNVEQIQAELVCNANQIYRVGAISSDTSLTTLSTVAPVLPTGSQYVLAALPEVPREHIRVIGAIAMAKMYSVAADDARTAEWTATAASNMQMMKDSLIERQGQNPPQKQRFPYGIGRRNRAFLN